MLLRCGLGGSGFWVASNFEKALLRQAQEPNSADKLADGHQDGVDRAFPDDGAEEELGDGYGEADGGEKEGFKDAREWLGVVLVEEGEA